MDSNDVLENLGYVLYACSEYLSDSIDVPILCPLKEEIPLTDKERSELGVACEILFLHGWKDGIFQESYAHIEENKLIDLLFFFVPFILGALTYSIPVTRTDKSIDMDSRIHTLEFARKFYLQGVKMISKCDITESELIELVDEFISNNSEYSDTEVETDPIRQRELKITYFKVKQQYHDVINNFKSFYSVAGCEPLSHAKIDLIDENEQKRHIIACLRYLQIMAMEQLQLLDKEIRMLTAVSVYQNRKGAKVENVSNVPSKPESPIFTLLPGGKVIKGTLQATDMMNQSNSEFGIRVANRVGKTAEGILTADKIRHDVFKPFYTLPTVSLAECADYEMRVDVGALGSKDSKKRVDEDGVEYQDPSAFQGNINDKAKNDDEESESSETTRAKRQWDDWCDLNPKGMGNTMHNRS